MADRPAPQAGGILLALFILAGALIGAFKGQPTIGVLAGTGAGVLAALALWLADRARSNR
jgi:uncharacterized membrane protein (UPF0136 family)